MMTTATDIEIYLRGIKTSDVEAWLNDTFEQVTALNKKKGMPKGAHPFSVCWHNQQIKVIAFEDVEPGFTSVWFDSTNLPWHSDEQCALAAATYFKCRVRVTAGSWDQSAEPDAWLEITHDGQKTSLVWPPS